MKKKFTVVLGRWVEYREEKYIAVEAEDALHAARLALATDWPKTDPAGDAFVEEVFETSNPTA